MVLNRIATTEIIKIQIKTFNNSKVRAGQVIGDTFKHVRELTRSIEDKLNKEILSAKLDKTKQKDREENRELSECRGSKIAHTECQAKCKAGCYKCDRNRRNGNTHDRH